MKKLFCILFCLLFPLLCCSCESAPDMESLLSYQKEGAVFRLSVKDGSSFSATLTLGEKTVLAFSDEEFDTLFYTFEGDTASLSNGTFSLPLTGTTHLKAKKWVSLFALPCEGPWQIEAKTVGGSAVYRCTTDGITLYVDTLGVPLRIESGNTVIDIVSVKNP